MQREQQKTGARDRATTSTNATSSAATSTSTSRSGSPPQATGKFSGFASASIQQPSNPFISVCFLRRMQLLAPRHRRVHHRPIQLHLTQQSTQQRLIHQQPVCSVHPIFVQFAFRSPAINERRPIFQSVSTTSNANETDATATKTEADSTKTKDTASAVKTETDDGSSSESADSKFNSKAFNGELAETKPFSDIGIDVKPATATNSAAAAAEMPADGAAAATTASSDANPTTTQPTTSAASSASYSSMSIMNPLNGVKSEIVSPISSKTAPLTTPLIGEFINADALNCFLFRGAQ